MRISVSELFAIIERTNKKAIEAEHREPVGPSNIQIGEAALRLEVLEGAIANKRDELDAMLERMTKVKPGFEAQKVIDGLDPDVEALLQQINIYEKLFDERPEWFT